MILKIIKEIIKYKKKSLIFFNIDQLIKYIFINKN